VLIENRKICEVRVKFINFIIVLFFTVFSTGCLSTKLKNIAPTKIPITSELTLKSKHDFYPSSERQYMSCDYKGWCVNKNRKDMSCGGESYSADNQYMRVGLSSLHAQPEENRNAALKSFQYALMSNNVYRNGEEKPIFALPEWTLVERYDYPSGLVLEMLIKRTIDNHIEEVAIAFKGTDFNSGDDWLNNVAFKEPPQYREAQEYVKNLLKSQEYKGVRISVTGHSLGGGLALNVALRQSTKERPINAFVFNSSPRAFFGDYDLDSPGDRYLIDETGEILWYARSFWYKKFKRMYKYRYRFNLLNYDGVISKAVSEHGIYQMSRALLLISVGLDNVYAREVFKVNFDLQDINNVIDSNSFLLNSEERTYDIERCKAILL
jgi:hypothetical protein